MKRCAVPDCTSRRGRTKDVFFHEFPANYERREAWVKIVGALHNGASDPWVPAENAKVCSKHFKPEDYVKGAKRCLLLPYAVPSQFQPSAQQKQTQCCRFHPRRCQQLALEDCGSAAFGVQPKTCTEPVSGSGQQAGSLRDNSLEHDDDGQQTTGVKFGSHVGVATLPMVIRPLRDSASECTCKGQQIADGEVGPSVRVITMPGMANRSPRDTITGMDGQGPVLTTNAVEESNGSRGSDVSDTPCSVSIAAGNCVEAVPVDALETSSVACQTHVSGLTIAAYEEQIKLLKKECKHLREEVCELRRRQLCTEVTQ